MKTIPHDMPGIYLIKKITGDNWRPGMPREGWLVRYGASLNHGWRQCYTCKTPQEAEHFARNLTSEIENERQMDANYAALKLW